MEKLKVLIIGGVAGGASAAARLRRMNEQAEIILFEKGEYISFANCGLPYYVGEVIREKEKLLVQTPEGMGQRFDLDIRIKSEVTAIDLDKKIIKVVHLPSGRAYEESFDKLILSPGAEPLRPPIPGFDGSNVFTLRSIPDTYAIKDYVDHKKPKHAVVVGGGFIGLEMAENLHLRGLKIAVVEMADQVMAPLDYEMAAIVHQHLRFKNAELYLKDGIKEIKHHKGYSTVVLQSGATIDTGMIVMGIGVRPDIKLAKAAGIEIGKLNGIKVDQHLVTSHPDVYAIGDAIEVLDFVSSTPALIPLAGPANKQGRIAANHICGIPDTYKATQGTSIVKVYDLTVATTGNNEKNLTKHGIPYEKSYTHSASHAGYYPGSITMSIKLLFSPDTGKILGAQIVGVHGVDKRIDVLATALRAGLTVYDLQELELAYAPPFSSAKDPVNMAGYVASNILNGDHPVIHWHELKDLPKDSLIIDVRTKEEHDLGGVPNAALMPLDSLREHLDDLPKDKEIVVYCQVGLRGYLAVRVLRQHGYARVRNLSGGLRTYAVVLGNQSDEDMFMPDNYVNDDGMIDNIEKEDDALSLEGSLMKIDTCGLQCPGPISQVYKAFNQLNVGDVLEVKATDPTFPMDVKIWCGRTGNQFIGSCQEKDHTLIRLRKGASNMTPSVSASSGNDKTMVVFSGELDKALASFIIANGAAAMGRKVTMFFTFWGINILRRSENVSVKKTLIERMFGFMMPRGSEKLALSKMQMGGMGSKMIKYIMQQKNVDSLKDLIQQAKENGVHMVVCNMSMDLMGIKQEELIDGVTIGGVAAYLGAAETADTNLFI